VDSLKEKRCIFYGQYEGRCKRRSGTPAFAFWCITCARVRTFVTYRLGCIWRTSETKKRG